MAAIGAIRTGKGGVRMDLKVVTMNIRYGAARDGENAWLRRRTVACDCIGHMGPDLLCLQECLPFQSDEIKDRFPYMDHFGLGRYHLAPDIRPQEADSGEHCAIFFDARRLSLESCGTFWHSDTPDVPGTSSWGNSLARITTYGLFRLVGEEKSLAVFNTHYDWGDEYLEETTNLMLRRMESIAGDMPVVLTGDFNLTPDSRWHAAYERSYRDVWSLLSLPEEGAGTYHGYSGTPERRIDWILISTGVVPVAADVVTWNSAGRYPSDHFPVAAVLRIS